MYSLMNRPLNNAKYIPFFWKIWKQGTQTLSSLKLSIQKTKVMASGPITWWQIDGETLETGTDFLFLGSKITLDSDCSYEIKR